MRGNQRGVVKVVSSLLLAGVGALLSVAGCAVDSTGKVSDADGSLGESQAALCSKGVVCPPDSACGKWDCATLGSACKLVEAGAADGTRCTTGDKVVLSGICAGNMCCTDGCLERTKTGYICRPGTATTACGLPAKACEDCTVTDKCVVGVCTEKRGCDKEAAPANSSCSDGDKCNGEESCSGTTCQPGKKLDCDDGQECTTDSCDATGGCTHVARTGEACNDGDACTTDDKCGADGLCKAGTQINCDDGKTCTTDTCAAGKCVSVPVTDNTGCNDNDVCTVNDKCVAGKCTGTSANGVDCDDKNVCTLDKQVACNSTECSHSPAPATTGCPAVDKCHENGHCSGTDGTCVAGEPINCDDSNPCTTDSCVAATGCMHVNNAAADCSDGDPCTENDVCVGGVCGGKPKKCLALDSCHESGTCDPDSGTCDDPRSKDGKECQGGGTCQSGKCETDPNANAGGQNAGGQNAGGQNAGGDANEAGAANGGDGAAATTGGENATGGTSTSGGKNTGATTSTGDGGEDAVPRRPFTRDPGGCSCNLPGSSSSSHLAWLGGLSLAALVLGRRRGRGTDRRAA